MFQKKNSLQKVPKQHARNFATNDFFLLVLTFFAYELRTDLFLLFGTQYMIYVSLKQKLLCKHYSLLNAFFSLHLTMFRPQQTTQYVHSIKMITYLMFYERLILALVINACGRPKYSKYRMQRWILTKISVILDFTSHHLRET